MVPSPAGTLMTTASACGVGCRSKCNGAGSARPDTRRLILDRASCNLRRVADLSEPEPSETSPDPLDAPGNLGAERFGHGRHPEPFAHRGVAPVDRLPRP